MQLDMFSLTPLTKEYAPLLHRAKNVRMETSKLEQVENVTSLSCKYDHDVEKFMKNKSPDIGPKCYLFDTRGV